MRFLFFLALAMTIKTAPSIDSTRDMSKMFLPYQVDHILSTARYRAVEKAVQIGYTWTTAFKEVRKRLLSKKRDLLFVTKDEATAIEFVSYCRDHCELFNLTKTILTHGVESVTVPTFDLEGRELRVTEEVKVASIKFDTGCKIRAFSSNPNAVRSFPGDVDWDEAAFAKDAERTYAAMQGRLQWGYDWGIWSSHAGDSTLFCDIIDHAKESEQWEHDAVDIYRAIEEGLVEKINQTRGLNLTREAFLADCKARARFGSFEQEYELKRLGGRDPIAAWERIAACQHDYAIDRAHLGDGAITQLFGAPEPHRRGWRQRQVENWTRQTLCSLFDSRKHGNKKMRVGFDVAASGRGHLAAIYVDEKTAGGQMVCRALVTFQTEDWDVMKSVLWTLLAYYPGEIRGAGDETGLGRQICWETAQKFGGRFVGINFSARKQEMGAALMMQLSEGSKRFPKGEPDIGTDYYAIQKTWNGSKWVFSESLNRLNEASHCDIAWAGALATAADTEGGPELWVKTIECD